MVSLSQRLDALARGSDRVEVRIGTAGGAPCMVFVGGKPAPGYRLPDRCGFTITNPRPAMGNGEDVPDAAP